MYTFYVFAKKTEETQKHWIKIIEKQQTKFQFLSFWLVVEFVLEQVDRHTHAHAYSLYYHGQTTER